MNRLAKYFLRGLLVLIPVVVTGYVVYAIFIALDEAVFRPLGGLIHREAADSALLSALGVAGAIALIVLAGVLASNLLGGKLVALVERLLEKLPLIKLLYGSVRDVLGAFVGDQKSFDHPVVVALSAGGDAKVVGFVTRDSLEFLGIEGHVAVYLPQSYNFAGNLLLVPADRVQPLSASSSDVMTFLVSGGVSGRKKAGTGEP